MKYFYTDPLEAAYMAKHFGVKFHDYDWSFDLIECLEGITHDRNYVIHPDIYHILEPQVGDLLLWSGHYHVAYTEDEAKKFKYGKIIQRNGKAFFWPEMDGVAP